MTASKRQTATALNKWLALSLFAAWAITFVLYVYSIAQADRANDMRYKSLLVIEELRQTPNDLTHMARSYIATGDPIYKQYYVTIMAIANGQMPRPKNYNTSYWEKAVVSQLPSLTEAPISMLELLRKNGFTEHELDILKASKRSADALSKTELAAMELTQEVGPEGENKRQLALSMVFGDEYNRAKASITQPIDKIHQLQDIRTLQAVHHAERNEILILAILIGFGLGLVFMLWRISKAVRITLGDSADEIYRHIRLIGAGDFSANIKVAKGHENSVLAWLAETQHNLLRLRQERLDVENAKLKSDERFRRTFKLVPNPLSLQTPDGIMLDCSDAFCELTGFERDQVININTATLNVWADPDQRTRLREILLRDGKVDNFEFVLRRKNGERRYMQISSRFLDDEKDPVLLSVAQDITEQKIAEEELRASEKSYSTLVKNISGAVYRCRNDAEWTIEFISKGCFDITGYAPEDLIANRVTSLGALIHTADAGAVAEKCNINLNNHKACSNKYRIIHRNGEIRWVWDQAQGVYSDSGELLHIEGLLTDITEQKLTEEEVHRLAFYDPLTNLPNRRLLYDRLQQAILTSCRTDQHGALMFLDLDHFKQLNDSLGHDIGDILLQHVALRLQACVREGDSVARMGGDEFVMLLEALSVNPTEAASQAETIAHKILASLAEPYHLREHTYVITPSIGIVVFLHQAERFDELLKKADVAMYQAKNAGRNNAQFFDPTMQEAASVRLTLEKNMRLALEQNQFLLHYQFQVNSQSTPTGVEALIRWHHPEHGMISPASFIPLAEETGMILAIGQWVLETACEQLVEWAATPTSATWTIAINVSASQFAQPNFVANVKTALLKTGANPYLLKLELTESMFAKDVEDVIVKMVEIKALGVTFSLDDFGTGYSSLSYLKRLPLDQLKIDQSFVRDLLTDINDATIAQTIIALGHSLSLNVIAEGVETLEQRDALAAMGCDNYQGYYFARPVTAENLLETAGKIPH